MKSYTHSVHNGVYEIIIPAHTTVDVYEPDDNSWKHVRIIVHEHAHVHYYGSSNIYGQQHIVIQCILQGAYAQMTYVQKNELTDQTHYVCTIEQHHQGPYTQSSVELKTVVDHQASITYNGSIVIAKTAVHAKASQIHKALLMSDQAKVHSQPMLEVETHEVQCSHGSAIAAINKFQMWFLASRGIEHNQAKTLLKDGFME